jgi:hypothetical protein
MQRLLTSTVGFIQKWFGFHGWKSLSAKGSIVATIFYRVFFVIGLALAIITYSYISGGDDPSLIWITAVSLVWFLFFQLMINLIFVNGSR